MPNLELLWTFGEKLLAWSNRKRCLLIVEDDPDDAELLQYAITAAGYQCDIARSAEEGLGMLRAKRHPVAFLDSRLPGMSGCKMADRVLNEIPSTHVILVMGEPSDIALLKTGRYVGVLNKPVSREAVLDVVKKTRL